MFYIYKYIYRKLYIYVSYIYKRLGYTDIYIYI